MKLPIDFTPEERIVILEKTVKKLERRISALENQKPFVSPRNRILQVKGKSMSGIQIGTLED